MQETGVDARLQVLEGEDVLLELATSQCQVLGYPLWVLEESVIGVLWVVHVLVDDCRSHCSASPIPQLF